MPATAPESYTTLLALPPIVSQILYGRGLTDPDQAKSFLAITPEPHSPFAMRGMTEAVQRLREAIRTGETIAIYGDFDVDGVTATALLVLTIRALGGEVTPYIPHRVREGYGLNKEALTELAEQGVRVVITVDCGVRAVEEIAHARRLGLDVIVTDHHTLGPELPETTAVLDPRREDCPYPYKHLAGVGVAYKLAQALLRVNAQVPIVKENSTYLNEEDLLDLVALGTVADLAPLTGENRLLVQQGLKRINATPRPGLEALMRHAGQRANDVDELTIGYSLGPRINAAGRINHAKTAYQLLAAEYPGEVDRLAQELNEMNRTRQQITVKMLEKAQQIVSDEGQDRLLLFAADPEFPAGIVGLVASRLLEAFYRPAVIVEQGGEYSRGSARSIPEFHITQALDACNDLLVRYGGHRAAAGFTVHTRDLPKFRARLEALAAEALEGKDLTPQLEVHAEVPLSEMGWDLWEMLQVLRPFGEENPEPLFVSRDVELRHYRAVGTNGAHLKLYLSDGQVVWDGIAFRQGAWANRLPERIDIAYHLQRNDWNGERRLQLNVQDIHPVGWEKNE
jgi:single-stranded-DNA-specific exonuclease